MKILFCGDVVGRSGREAVLKHVPKLRAERGLDFVIVNGDNAAGGFGITPEICAEFFKAGADVVTGGDHIWDQKEIIPLLAKEKRLLRPHNFPPKNPGRGMETYSLADGRKIMVIHLLGQVFHKEHTACPFAMADELLTGVKMGQQAHAIFVDFHAEATSEKCALGLYLDGRVSAVVGTHTHIPTADTRVLPKGTAYQTDAGMCGDYTSVIGFAQDGPLTRFLTKVHKTKMEPASGDASLCGVIVQTDDKTGLTSHVERVQLL